MELVVGVGGWLLLALAVADTEAEAVVEAEVEAGVDDVPGG